MSEWVSVAGWLDGGMEGWMDGRTGRTNERASEPASLGERARERVTALASELTT